MEAFNRSVLTTSIGDFNIGFPGQYWDAEKQSWYNYFRDYDATLGRYLQSDPIGLAGGLNTYVYTRNNAVRYIDPLGLDIHVCYYSSFPTHVGAGVNSNDTFGRRTQNGGMWNVPGRVSRDLDNNDQSTQSCKVIKSTPEQDNAWEKYQAENVANPGVYNLNTRSCVDYVRDGLINILGMKPSNGDFPSDLYNSINPTEPNIITRPSRGGLL